MSEGLVDGDTFVGIEDEELVKQVDGLGSSLGENSLQLFAFLFGERTHILLTLLPGDGVDVFLGGSPHHIENQVDLVFGVLARQERLPPHKLGEHTSHRPHVHRAIVLLPR